MKKLMYIHGYGSTGKAIKAQLLQEMFPEHQVLAPTFDYANESPSAIYRKLQEFIQTERPNLILGSSTGGYYALCCTHFYCGPVWCVNPVRDIFDTIDRIFPTPSEEVARIISQRKAEYETFDRDIFQTLHPFDGQLNFALSTDDELLGDHTPLLTRYPNHNHVVWKEHSGHRFLRFAEIKQDLTETLK